MSLFMKNRLCVLALFLVQVVAFSQTIKLKADKYPSLLWEISGRGLAKPSYLFGTMHVSSKMVFNLSDSFYIAIKKAEVVALETDPASWQANFSRYDMEGESFRSGNRKNGAAPQDYLTINSFRLTPYEKSMEAVLSSSPSIINSFLYRSDSEAGSDFEEDTYLDLHIFQTGKKLGKKICGVEDFDGSMQLVKEAYHDAAKEKRKTRSFNDDDEFSYTHLEEAYRSGNLDLLDTINKVNSQSAAFDEKFLYRRNEIQAASIDSILKTGATLFAGVGAAHLPGRRGVIEILRSQGYRLRPVRIKAGDSQRGEKERPVRVPVQFTSQSAADGFYTVSVPGTLYNFGKTGRNTETWQYADMINGSYYMVTRLATHAAILGQSDQEVLQNLDSVLYENIPGKILVKKRISRNGYPGIDITARTRRGDVQRYNLFVTPFELLVFKMSGNGTYVQQGTEADRFFSSIQLKNPKTQWKRWSPAAGGFEVLLPHPPMVFTGTRQVYAAYDPASKTAFEILRNEIHNHQFLEADSFDLDLVEESFAASENIARCLQKQRLSLGGYPALDAVYKAADSSVLKVRFLLQGPHYYTLVTGSAAENRYMNEFLHSFAIRPFCYGEAKPATDTLLQYRVQTPVALEKPQKLQFYGGEEEEKSDDDSLVDNGTFNSRVIASSETGERIAVSYYKPSAYHHRGAEPPFDSAAFKRDWVLRRRTSATLASGLTVTEYELGKTGSSRMLKTKLLTKDGAGYKLETELDTLGRTSDFVRTFFNSFQPLDTFAGLDLKAKKTGLFFSQFFSTDTLLHQKAIKNLSSLLFDSADLPQLQRCIGSLSWSGPAYLDTKKALIGKLAFLRSRGTADYLVNLYRQAGDTVDLQYAALEALLRQKTAYAFAAFGRLMATDPPVLQPVENGGSAFYSKSAARRFVTTADSGDEGASDGSFLEHLTDSLALTAGIVKELLPLLNLTDYRQAMLEVLGALVDSAQVSPADYAAYLPNLLPEAKQLAKKQRIREQTRAIEKAKAAVDDKGTPADDITDDDTGNAQLTLMATLLLPFWNGEPQVQQLFAQLVQSTDRQLQYSTAMLLLRRGHPVPDSLWLQFAALDDFRFRLYTDLDRQNRLSLFPAAYKTRLLLARSQLASLQPYNRPDTLAFLEALPVQSEGQQGELYFFKYKEKKEDMGWKIATAGLFPSDSASLVFKRDGQQEEDGTGKDFTDLGATRLSTALPQREQLQKLVKKLLYSRRKSAVQFYNDDQSFGEADFLRGRN